MEKYETYYLNKSTKAQTTIIGGTSFVIFCGLSVLFALQNIQQIDFTLLIFVFFALLGLEIIYEGLRSRIQISDEGIVYYQPRFVLACKWEELVGIIVYPQGVAIKFSKSNILSGKIVVLPLRILGPWDRSIPLSSYLSLENIGLIRKSIQPYLINLQDEDRDFMENLLR